MKKTKRLISVFLAAIMLMSTISAFNVAFAAEAAEKKENQIIEAIEKGKTTVDEASKVIVDAYQKLVNSSKELTEEQKAKKEKLEGYINDLGQKVSGAISSVITGTTGKATSNKAKSANATTAVADFEKLVNDFNGKLSISKPADMDNIKAEDLAAYDAIIKAYNALTAEQKDAVGILEFDKMLHLIYDREQALLLVADPKISTANKNKQAHENVTNVIGEVSFLKNAEEAGAILTDTKKTADEMIEAFKSCTTLKARVYAGIWYASYGNFYYKVDAYPSKALTNIVKAYTDKKVKDTPFTEAEVKKGTAPNVKDTVKYPLGKEDPAYIADYAIYMESYKANVEWQCRKANYSSAFNIEIMAELAKIAPEYQPMMKFIEMAMAANEAFTSDNTKTQPAKKALEYYDTLSDFDKLLIEKTSVVLNTIPKEASTYWSTTAQYPRDFDQICIDIGNFSFLGEFISVVNSIKEPYTNKDIDTVKTAFAKVPASLVNQIPKETNDKYKAILASITIDIPSTDTPDLSIFNKTNVKYPIGVKRSQVNSAIIKTEDLIFNILGPVLGLPDGGLTEMLQTGVYTNQTVATIAGFLFPLLVTVEPSLLAKLPADLAKTLKEEKFAGAKAALEAIEVVPVLDENGNQIKLDTNKATWATAKFQNGDWGFQDGDKEGFLDAVSALFRPFSIITLVISLENKVSTTNGTYTYGGYEDLVPIFEMLDLDGVMSSDEYTKYVNNTTGDKMDARIRPILVPVLNLIDKIAADPLETFMDLLPKIGYLLKTDTLDSQIHKLASKVGMVTIPEFSLKTEAIFDMIAPALQNLNINGLTFSFNLDKDAFVKFVSDEAGAGKAVVKPSIARGTAYRLGIETDRSDAFVLLYRWLYSELTSAQNVETYKTMVDSLELSNFEKYLIKVTIDNISRLPSNLALIAIVNLIDPRIPFFK